MIRRFAWLVFLSALVSCGGDNKTTSPTPATPTTTSIPATAQVGGVWTGTVTQTSVNGGECANLFQLSTGVRSPFSLQVTQSGSSLTATAASQSTGQSCSYTGTAGGSSVALTGTGCQPSGYQATCDGFQRDVYISSYSATGTVSGNTLSGTTGATYNVFARGSITNGLGLVVVNSNFTFTR